MGSKIFWSGKLSSPIILACYLQNETLKVFRSTDKAECTLDESEWLIEWVSHWVTESHHGCHVYHWSLTQFVAVTITFERDCYSRGTRRERSNSSYSWECVLFDRKFEAEESVEHRAHNEIEHTQSAAFQMIKITIVSWKNRKLQMKETLEYLVNDSGFRQSGHVASIIILS